MKKEKLILTDRERGILESLRSKGEFAGPSEISETILKKGEHRASVISYTSKACRRLVENGFLVRNEKGHYKFKKGKKF
ncbi:MAG: hypothetical protein OEY34_07605 [Cyclobacteriaceae bacterium]|nr:hypothetical protein [Cyclobacteriaceae bacterium]